MTPARRLEYPWATSSLLVLTSVFRDTAVKNTGAAQRHATKLTKRGTYRERER